MTTLFALSDSSSAVPTAPAVMSVPPNDGYHNQIHQHFGIDFSVFDGNTGKCLNQSAQQPIGDAGSLSEFIQTVADGCTGVQVAKEGPLLVYAMPLTSDGELKHVGVGVFVVEEFNTSDNVESTARLLGTSTVSLIGWIKRQPVWSAEAVYRLGDALLAKLNADEQIVHLQRELASTSENLANCYEELSLLHGVTKALKTSRGIDHLIQSVPTWLMATLPLGGIAVQLLPTSRTLVVKDDLASTTQLFTFGECPIDNATVSWFVDRFHVADRSDPLVINVDANTVGDWPYPEIRQLIMAPIAAGDFIEGWLIAVNHRSESWFGTVEASLLESVAAVLGLCIHSSRGELIREEADFLGNVVQAFVSTIDARDPYTCGHSDRVARIAVRLGRECGCDEEDLNTLFIAGLLHDVGNIGVDERILRKSDSLSRSERDQVRKHPEIGRAILAGVKQLHHVFPVILHHHEKWDGSGYPDQLKAEEIPLLARILAVAEAFEAMTSDRAYRRRLPDTEVDSVFRTGSGRAWDPYVIKSFFRIREPLRKVVQSKTTT